jgi:hypothetical protein
VISALAWLAIDVVEPATPSKGPISVAHPDHVMDQRDVHHANQGGGLERGEQPREPAVGAREGKPKISQCGG